ncbi:aryl-alcohol dehydrogenase-like predicted oxidoreductase [Sagittula marina]|uniref:Aryl-alcohol dehydrogenase-like predicted oxidoreductase n=1 Tax=Sagittula marina TaxID=943940 RepID=A0A7W6GSF4_9RHOB|nr:aldo/keto reductase [Sagittula marina]MBB3985910.1 aryl-alcohol dehydrogenase-like predicted oxidoreductase [Sagittula marina]
MLKRKLGADGPEVSALGLGGMSFSNFYGPVSEAEAHAVLDAAVEAGVNHVDTSNIYGMGRSEEVIGSWLAKRGGDNPFRIATKAGITTDANGQRAYDNTFEHLASELDGSLARLGLEQVDLFYVHRRDPRLEIEEVVESLVALQQTGKIKAFGFSEIAPTSLKRAAAVAPVAAVQSEYSLQTRLPELGLIQMCEAVGTSLVAFSSVGRGLLTDRPPQPGQFAEGSFMATNPRFSGGNLERNLTVTEGLRDLARDVGVPTASLAIAWVLGQSPAILTIPGTRSVDHFGELVTGAESLLDPDLLIEIEKRLPVGWCHGDRYADAQNVGPERYC